MKSKVRKSKYIFRPKAAIFFTPSKSWSQLLYSRVKLKQKKNTQKLLESYAVTPDQIKERHLSHR